MAFQNTIDLTSLKIVSGQQYVRIKFLFVICHPDFQSTTMAQPRFDSRFFFFIYTLIADRRLFIFLILLGK